MKFKDVPEGLPPDDDLNPEDYYDDYRPTCVDSTLFGCYHVVVNSKIVEHQCTDQKDVCEEKENLVLEASNQNKLGPIEPLVFSLHSARTLHNVLSRLKCNGKIKDSLDRKETLVAKEQSPYWLKYLDKCKLPAPVSLPGRPVGQRPHQLGPCPEPPSLGDEAATFLVLDAGSFILHSTEIQNYFEI